MGRIKSYGKVVQYDLKEKKVKEYTAEQYSKWGQHIHNFHIFSEQNEKKLLRMMSFSVVTQSLSNDAHFQITYVKENEGGQLIQLSP